MKELFINVERNDKGLLKEVDLRSRIEGADLYWKERGCRLWDYEYKILENKNPNGKKYKMEMKIRFVIDGEPKPKINLFSNIARKLRVNKLKIETPMTLSPALKQRIRED
jgi:hypothetical protein